MEDDSLQAALTFNVLDHGYLKYIDNWGSDEQVIEAARMSTGKGFLGWGPFQCDCVTPGAALPLSECADPDCKKCKGTGLKPGDEGLLRYLWKHDHHTPFEMCGITIEVQAPIMVFREWHRHRTQSYNELSARYTPIPDVNYVPTVERCMRGAGSNKQAQGTGETLTSEHAENWKFLLSNFYADVEAFYQYGLRIGVPKELARLCIPVGRYSRMRASGNLRNWLAFYKLRAAENAQWEIRQYADCIGKVIADVFPRTWEIVNAN